MQRSSQLQSLGDSLCDAAHLLLRRIPCAPLLLLLWDGQVSSTYSTTGTTCSSMHGAVGTLLALSTSLKPPTPTSRRVPRLLLLLLELLIQGLSQVVMRVMVHMCCHETPNHPARCCCCCRCPRR
jgi:hypothetical protein